MLTEATEKAEALVEGGQIERHFFLQYLTEAQEIIQAIKDEHKSLLPMLREALESGRFFVDSYDIDDEEQSGSAIRAARVDTVSRIIEALEVCDSLERKPRTPEVLKSIAAARVSISIHLDVVHARYIHQTSFPPFMN